MRAFSRCRQNSSLLFVAGVFAGLFRSFLLCGFAWGRANPRAGERQSASRGRPRRRRPAAEGGAAFLQKTPKRNLRLRAGFFSTGEARLHQSSHARKRAVQANRRAPRQKTTPALSYLRASRKNSVSRPLYTSYCEIQLEKIAGPAISNVPQSAPSAGSTPAQRKRPGASPFSMAASQQKRRGALPQA